VFLLSVLLFEHAGRQQVQSRLWEYVRVGLPVYAVFLFFDRLYQFYRFGNWTTTYVHYFTIEHRLQDPSLPANYPWTTPFFKGFLGPLLSPEKTIFLFDPLILLCIVVVIFGWKHFSSCVKAYLVSAFLLITAYMCFYARYFEWSGNFAWGDRYVSTAVQIAAFISVPVLLKLRVEFGRNIWRLGMCLIIASLVIQVASLAFWLPLEIYQADDFGHPQWILWLRFRNIVAFALGKMDTWGLSTDSMTYDPWDYQHITCWNFLPLVLRRIGDAPKWVVDLAFGVWGAGIAALTISLAKLRAAIPRVPEE
jgi:hypothetical protein